MNTKTDILARLERILEARKKAGAEDSYVASLYQGGHPAIARKITEEAAELVEAAAGDDRRHTVHEAADLLFHCQVMLAHKGIAISEVLDELARRLGTSGHAEKRRRKNP